MKTEKKNAVLNTPSPLRLFFSLLLAIFGSEMLIMFIILPILFRGVEGVFPNMTDSFLLTLLIAPYLWISIVRPLRQAAGRLDEELKKKVEELVEAQDELVRKEKLATLGQIAGSVGHELRNPLGVMNNAVYYLQTVLANGDETTRDYLGIIKNEIAAAERIVSDLLDAVRAKPPRPRLIPAEELIKSSLEKCSMPVSVRVDVKPATRRTVLVDPLQMIQVFINAARNAVDAMPGGGVLTICAVEDEDKGLVRFTFRDEGDGIAPENRVRLFQPLFTTKARGIGLGLVVMKNLTEANGGNISVESTVGTGTTFTITLPAAEA